MFDLINSVVIRVLNGFVNMYYKHIPYCFTLAILICTLPLFEANAGTGIPEERPNIVLIIVDDSEFIEYACYGGHTLSPNIDRIAETGVLFTNGFTSTSVCTPTRYSVLTGKYASRAESLRTIGKQPDNMPTFVAWNTVLEQGEQNVAAVLQENGYKTALVGKWHLGYEDHWFHNKDVHGRPSKIDDEKILPLDDPEVNAYLKRKYDSDVKYLKQDHGFDYVGSFYEGNLSNWPRSMKNWDVHNQDWITSGALDFIDECAEEDEPFFLYFSTTLQHGPEPLNSINADRRATPSGMLENAPDVQPGPESIYARLDQAGLKRDKASFLWLDDGIGAMMERLAKYDMMENTVFFFFADQQSWGKASCLDGGVNTPYLVSWPAGIEGGQVIDELVSNIDFTPTIFDICRAEVPGNMILDGKSFLPIIKGRNLEWREALFFEIGNMRAVRTKDFKFIVVRRYSDEDWLLFPEEVRESQAFRRRRFRLNSEWSVSSLEKINNSPVWKWRFDHALYAEHSEQFYDLRTDPGENVNLAGNPHYREEQDHMVTLLRGWLETLPGPFWEFK